MEFTAWPKTPRLFREAVVTEKIDGTNAAVIVEHVPPTADVPPLTDSQVEVGGIVYEVGAQSRSRLITPEADNFGFARWVREHAAELVATLGEGTHFGEWWGSGIQRGYDLPAGERRFSLFNVHRYAHVMTTVGETVPGLGLVPELARDVFSTALVHDGLVQLQVDGSHAAPGFMRPEGVVVFHTAAGSVFKALIENDHAPKGAN